MALDNEQPATVTKPVALITGAAKRLGAKTTRELHQAGFDVIIHYHSSQKAAQALATQLNESRANSAHTLQADLNNHHQVIALACAAIQIHHRLDVLINNASTFYPTPLADASESQWQDLFASNSKAPYFLAQQLSNELAKQQGCIINMVDIYASRPKAQHSIYSMAKSSLVTLTKSLAKELAPDIRVNGVAPGVILWPETISEAEKQQLLADIPLAKIGDPKQIAETILFLIRNDYITGQIIAVDGGRSL